MAKASIFLVALCVFEVIVVSSSTATEEDCDDCVDPQIDEWTKKCLAASEGKTDSASTVQAYHDFLTTEVNKCCDEANETMPPGCDRRDAAIAVNKAYTNANFGKVRVAVVERITNNNSPENQKLVCDEGARELADQCGSCAYMASLANGTLAKEMYCSVI